MTSLTYNLPVYPAVIYSISDMADQDEGDGPGELQWVECYDPIVEETYYYCHQNKETTYDPPDDYITAQEDPKMSAVIKIQCLGRKVCPYISCVRFTSKVLWCISSNYANLWLALRSAWHATRFSGCGITSTKTWLLTWTSAVDRLRSWRGAWGCGSRTERRQTRNRLLPSSAPRVRWSRSCLFVARCLGAVRGTRESLWARGSSIKRSCRGKSHRKDSTVHSTILAFCLMFKHVYMTPACLAAMSYGKHYFMFQISKLAHSGKKHLSIDSP